MRALLALATALGLAVPFAPAVGAGTPPAQAQLAKRVIGNGTPSSCTSAAVVKAVAQGGSITFDCGPKQKTIKMRATAKVVNTSRVVRIDGGGRVTLDGLGKRRILYQNTCDQRQTWTTDHCDDQQYPKLVVKGLTLRRGHATGSDDESGSGGAIYARGGQLVIADSTFARNRCKSSGPDVGGGAVRALDQWGDRPVRIDGSTFRRGRCSNGSGLSSIGVSWQITDSVFTDNEATGRGANPARPGTTGGGSGAAVYADGNDFEIVVRNTRMEGNHAREGGGAIFFVSNDRSGHLTIVDSTLRDNPSDGFETIPGIFYLGRQSRPTVTGSVVE
ncbi:hypothetical protein [Nocardioides sp. LHG3406-4]|uniref:hypothetical protein n=1 Tax=Nocardioides sp. LHG3406-4 TaxID=2804575 RepID=UPI003CE930BA